MKKSNLFLTLICSGLLLSSCTVMKVSERTDQGYFKSIKTATTIKSEKIDLDQHKDIIVVRKSENDFVLGMVKNINYFNNVITISDLEKEIIKDNKQDEVGNIQGKIGLNNIYRKYKKFFYLTFDQGSNSKKIQLKLTNPDTADEVFIAETDFDIVWSGVNDANTFNPLFNELIKYIEANSKTYKK